MLYLVIKYNSSINENHKKTATEVTVFFSLEGQNH